MNAQQPYHIDKFLTNLTVNSELLFLSSAFIIIMFETETINFCFVLFLSNVSFNPSKKSHDDSIKSNVKKYQKQNINYFHAFYVPLS